jgi:hypothetical protein
MHVVWDPWTARALVHRGRYPLKVVSCKAKAPGQVYQRRAGCLKHCPRGVAGVRKADGRRAGRADEQNLGQVFKTWAVQNRHLCHTSR